MQSIHDKLEPELQKTLLWEIFHFNVNETGKIYDGSGNNIIENREIKSKHNLCICKSHCFSIQPYD